MFRALSLCLLGLLPFILSACGTVGFVVDTAFTYGLPSEGEMDAFDDMQRGDRETAIKKLETILADFERTGDSQGAQRVRTNLGRLYFETGRLDDTDRVAKILASDPKHRAMGLSLMTQVADARGDTERAQALSDAAAEAWEDTYSITHLIQSGRPYQKAFDLAVAGNYTEAAPAWDDAGDTVGDDFGALTLQGRSYKEVGRFEDAERVLRKGLGHWQRAYGTKSPVLGYHMYSLAEALIGLGENEEAEELLREATMLNYVSGQYDNTLANIYFELGKLRLADDDTEGALLDLSRSTEIYEGVVSSAAVGTADALGDLQDTGRAAFALHANLLAREAGTAHRTDVASIIRLIQLAHRSAAGEAALSSAARLGASDPRIADLVGKRRDALESWRRAEGELQLAVLNADDPEAFRKVEDLRQSQIALGEAITEIDNEIARLQPKTSDLSGLRVLSLDELRAALLPDEVLLLFLVDEQVGLVAAIDQRQVLVERLTANADDIAGSIRSLRSTLDPTGLTSRAEIPNFEVEQSYALYQKLIQPIEAALIGKKHVLVVADRALASLPLSVLLTERVESPPRDLASHSDLPWFARQHAFSTLPSASALRALRIEAGRSRASSDFIGIGAPDLSIGGNAEVPLPPLAPLPEAERELREIAARLNRNADSLLVGAQATHQNLLAANPGNARVLVFATHGLDSDDTGIIGEPGLVLTPENDDGLLTASEIASLKLDADWVILSACNTASSSPEASNDVMSGLARAFLLAGTRSLLVSHWPVAADAAAELTPSLIASATSIDDSRSRALALQAAMLRLANGSSQPDFAHPLFWAPFVFVG